MTVRGIGAVLTLPDLSREQLAKYLADNPDMAPAIARELARRLAELEELADLVPRFLAPIATNAGRRLERMQGRPGTSPHKLDDAAEELRDALRALELGRKYAPTRNAILRALAV